MPSFDGLLKPLYLGLWHELLRLCILLPSKPPLTPVYFAAALVLHRGAEVTRCEPDMAMVHHLLSKIPDELVRIGIVCNKVVSDSQLNRAEPIPDLGAGNQISWQFGIRLVA